MMILTIYKLPGKTGNSVKDENDSGNENGSYSRMVYGSEEDDESDEVKVDSNKQKILSFAGITPYKAIIRHMTTYKHSTLPNYIV